MYLTLKFVNWISQKKKKKKKKKKNRERNATKSDWKVIRSKRKEHVSVPFILLAGLESKLA